MKKLGELFIQEGLISRDLLHLALEKQSALAEYKPLGEVLKDMGYITQQKLRDILLKYRKQILLGDLLLKKSMITENQLAECLIKQSKSGKKLGEILVENRIISKKALGVYLSIQMTVEKIDADESIVDRSLLSSMNMAFLRRKKVLPISFDRMKGRVKILMENPNDDETISDLEKMYKMRVEPILLTSTGIINRGIEELIEGYFDVWDSAF
jgi:hypothetical protein